MVERAPPRKQDEQYPLLKVDNGAGDNVGKHLGTTMATPGWGVTCTPKRSWLVRWPEYVSACWMTFILIGISFLVFYGLGIEAYRRQPVLVLHNNDSRSAGDVFYHQILPRGSSVPVMLYTDYLSYMANQYSSLNFHVLFLVDDTIQSSYRVSRHSRFFNTFVPMPLPNTYPLYKINNSAKRDLEELQKKAQNVNVTIMPLSKFMATTPLRYRWRNIPMQYVTFYARVFSVWQNGGVGMDLNNFNNNFINHLNADRKISAILKQHNDGIKPEAYANALNKIDREEEKELLSLFCGLIYSIINETKTFLTKNFQSPPGLVLEKDLNNTKDLLIRSHRNKRDISLVENNNATETKPLVVDILNSSYTNDLEKNKHQELFPEDININKTKIIELNNDVNILNLETFNKSEVRYDSLNKTGHPQVLFFYDFSYSADGVLPSFSEHGSIGRSDVGQVVRNSKTIKQANSELSLLSLDSEGTFISASARFHPFLGRLITAGCQRMHPKFAIQDTIITQCAGIFKEDTYCNNIYLL